NGEQRVTGNGLGAGAECGVTGASEGLSVNAYGELRDRQVCAGVSGHAEIVQQRLRGVYSLGGGIVPVVDPVSAVAGMVVHRHASGGVDGLVRGMQGPQVTVDRHALGSGPGSRRGRCGAVSDDREIAFYASAVVEDDGNAIGV